MCRKTKINVLSYDVRMWAEISLVLSQMHAFDRRTDGQTDRQTDGQKNPRNTVRCIACSRTVKMMSKRNPKKRKSESP